MVHVRCAYVNGIIITGIRRPFFFSAMFYISKIWFEKECEIYLCSYKTRSCTVTIPLFEIVHLILLTHWSVTL